MSRVASPADRAHAQASDTGAEEDTVRIEMRLGPEDAARFDRYFWRFVGLGDAVEIGLTAWADALGEARIVQLSGREQLDAFLSGWRGSSSQALA